MTLRQKLLETNLFLENDYFELYLKLIKENVNTEKQKFRTQKHHIIPRVYYKMNKLKGVNSTDNVVNLLYKDHILAHYYLALCSAEEDFKCRMTISINFILAKYKQDWLDNESLKKFTLDLDYYQDLYEQSKIYFGNKIKGISHTISEEAKEKISKINSGKVYVYKDEKVKSIYPEELDDYLSDGWKKGNPNCQKRNTHKGNTIVNKDGVEKYIEKEKLEEYLNNGWKHGRSKEHKESTRKGTQEYFDNLTKEEKVKIYATCGMKGKKQSKETIEKRISKIRGRKVSEEQKIKNSINKKGTIHMTNGIVAVMIKKEREEEFIKQGFYRGRLRNKNK